MAVSPELSLTSRTTELAQLEQMYRELRNGRGRVVFLTGEPGIGKSTLARGFLDHVSDDPEALALSAICIADQTWHRPYGAFRDILAQLAAADGGPEFGAVMRRQAPAWLAGAEPAATRHALFEQYLGIWRSISKHRQVVLLLDELQWSDRSSLDLLIRFGRSLGSLPVLVLCTWDRTASEEEDLGKTIQRRLATNVVELALRELDEPAIEAIVEEVLGGTPDEDVLAWISRAAGGRPFLAHQLVLWLLEQNVIRRRFFRYTLREGELPATVRDVSEILKARLENLEPAMKWTLEAAALSGSVVLSPVVAAQVGKSEEETIDLLDRAEDTLQLVESTDGDSAAGAPRSYRFRHPYIREALRERVPPRRAVRLLMIAAERIVEVAGRHVAEIADEVAGLHLRARSPEHVHEWSLRAAELAERLYAPYEVEIFLRAAARTAPDPKARLEIEHRLAGIYAATDRELEAEEILTAVLGRAGDLDDAVMEVRAGVLLGWLRLDHGAAPAEVSALAGRLVDLGRELEQPSLLVSALDLACAVAERMGRAEEALLMSEEAMHVADGSEDRGLFAQAAHRLARVHISFGSPQEGRTLADRALQAFDELQDYTGISECHHLLGTADFRAGDWDGALEHWTAALDRLEMAGVPEQKVEMQANIAELATLRGEFRKAREYFQAGLELAREMEDQAQALRCRAGIARLEFERGEYGTVIELTEEIRSILPESGAWKEDFQTTAIRALAYLELGDELQAWQEAARLEQLYQGKEGWFERRAEGDAVRIRVIDLDSDSWLAGMVAQQGIGETEDKDPYGEGFLQYHRAAVAARFDAGEARAAAERAVELFERLGAAPMLERARALLARLPEAEPAEPEEGAAEEITDDKIDQWFDSVDD